MSRYILDAYSKELIIPITPARIKALHQLIINFENRKDHTLTLNSPILGVYPIAFTTTDRNEFFDIFSVSRTEMISLIKGIKAIDSSRRVESDPMNQLVIWLLHLGLIDKKLSRKERDDFLLDLALLWHYKFFTSLVLHNFPYKANEDIMRATVNSLSNKYDIIRYGTWREVLMVRSVDLFDTGSIHYKTLVKFDKDKDVLYLISDTQTRIREKIKKIVAVYYNTKKLGDSIGSYSSVGNLDGEKVLTNQISTFDVMTNGVNLELSNVHSFLDDKLIRTIASMFKNLRPDMLRYILTKYSEVATIQSKTGELDLDYKIKGIETFVGIRILTRNIIQKSYRFCIKEKVNLSSKIAILSRIKNVFSSSRISDPDLVKIKDSVAYFIDQHGSTKREATNASLRISIILYIITKTFKYL
jgi:hypothetical protein